MSALARPLGDLIATDRDQRSWEAANESFDAEQAVADAMIRISADDVLDHLTGDAAFAAALDAADAYLIGLCVLAARQDYALCLIDREHGRAAPRFASVGCSACGRHFGPGNHGFSHCISHAGLRSIAS